MNIRTDLAAELKTDIEKKTGGVNANKEHYGDIEITTIEIENEIGARIIGKPVGKYISFALPPFLEQTDESLAVKIITSRLRSLFPRKVGTVLVVGLGNREITPDALGPESASRVLATRHIKKELGEVEGLGDLNPVAVLSPGVLGKTGIETLEIIKGAVERVKPGLVIAVDAFATADTERLGTTVQVSSSGISPGSGVGNSRKALDKNSLGVPVISIGVPTVVDATTLARELVGDNLPKKIRPFGREMFVTPREIDVIIKRAAKLISRVLNSALQPKYTLEEISALQN